MRRFVLVCAAASISALARTAAAQSEADSPAQTLYKEAVDLFKAGNVHAACSKLDESFRLEPATQTLFALAKCRQREGRLATAYAQLQDVEKRAQREGDEAKANDARARMKDIEPKLSQAILKLEARPEVDEVKIDGRVVPRTEWAAPIPLDPGAHQFLFSGAGKLDLEKKVDLKEGEIVTFAIDPLQDASAPPQTTTRQLTPSRYDDEGSHKTLGYILGGAGVASIVVGSVAGIVAINHKSTADDRFARRDPTFKDADDAASTTALVSTIAIGAGVALVGAGVYFIFFSGDAKKSTTAASLSRGAITF